MRLELDGVESPNRVVAVLWFNLLKNLYDDDGVAAGVAEDLLGVRDFLNPRAGQESQQR